MGKICGIYKITSPSNKVYIGQSVDISRRFNQYKRISQFKGQIKLYRSFLKYGVVNHKFEIIEECLVSELNNRERYYQDLFSVLCKNGLNCTLTKSSDRSGKLNEETRKKISDSNKGKIFSEETRKKMSIAKKGLPSSMLGKTHTTASKIKSRISAKNRAPMSDATRHKFRLAGIGRVISIEAREKLSIINKGKIMSKESKVKMSLSAKKRKSSLETNRKRSERQMGSNNYNSKKVLDTNTGKIYNCIKDAALEFGINYFTLANKLLGNDKNNTSLVKYNL